MATTERVKKSGSKGLPIVHRHAAGIDIGATFHVVAVPADADEEPVRKFNSFTGNLHELAEWLQRVGITTVAMESTGIYWIPVYEILESRGLEVVLVKARDAKTVPGRKTDVNDAKWIQRLHEHGLLRASFRPHESIVALRTYLRHRERMVEFSASHIEHMRKSADADEPSAASCRQRYHRNDRNEDHPGDCGRDTEPGDSGQVSG